LFVRTQTNGSRTYLLIVDNKWVRGKVKQHVLLRLGRLDELLASGQLDSLIHAASPCHRRYAHAEPAFSSAQVERKRVTRPFSKLQPAGNEQLPPTWCRR
jgi:hypothetical protein